MADPERSEDIPLPPSAAKKPLSAAAERALAEAAERRAEADRKAIKRSKGTDRKNGPDPTRYGDWENKGIASDF